MTTIIGGNTLVSREVDNPDRFRVAKFDDDGMLMVRVIFFNETMAEITYFSYFRQSLLIQQLEQKNTIVWPRDKLLIFVIALLRIFKYTSKFLKKHVFYYLDDTFDIINVGQTVVYEKVKNCKISTG